MLLLALLLPFLATQSPGPTPLEQALRASRWLKRVLVVAAPNAAQADYQQQKKLLAAAEAQLAERDLVVIEVFYDQLSAPDQRFLNQKTGVKPPTFAAVLIGKDGGVKANRARPITPQALFGTVDKMPMRREEMRQRKARRKQ